MTDEELGKLFKSHFPVENASDEDIREIVKACVNWWMGGTPPPEEITFYEDDGTERKLVYEVGDASVGIQGGYIPV